MKDKERGAILVHLSVASFYLLHGTDTAVMVVTTIDWHQICEVTEEECSVGKQLGLVVRGRSVGENDRDASTGLTVCFEEATLSVVDNDVTNFGKVHGMERTVKVRSVGFARRLAWHRAWKGNLVEMEFDVRVI